MQLSGDVLPTIRGLGYFRGLEPSPLIVFAYYSAKSLIIPLFLVI